MKVGKGNGGGGREVGRGRSLVKGAMRSRGGGVGGRKGPEGRRWGGEEEGWDI